MGYERNTTWIEDDVLGKIEVYDDEYDSEGNIIVSGGQPVNPYTTNYKDAIKALENQDPFEYSASNDPIYQQYRSAAEKSGKLAMKDTVGQIAALNGGYASSYAQTAGQQTYQSALDDVDNMIPELYEIARQRYDNETAALQANVDAYAGAYDRWNDTQIEDLTKENKELTDELEAKGLTADEIIAAQKYLDGLVEDAELAYLTEDDISGYKKMEMYLSGLGLSEDELADWLKLYGLTDEILAKIYESDTDES